MFCKVHPEMKIMVLNIDYAFTENRFACSDCLVKYIIEKYKYIGISQIQDDLTSIINKDNLKCNVVMNFDVIRQNPLKEYILRMKNDITGILDKLLEQVNQRFLTFRYKSKTSIDMILRMSGLNELHYLVQQANSPIKIDQLKFSAQITKLLKQYHKFEQSDEYKEINRNSISQYEDTIKQVQKQLRQSMNEIEKLTQKINNQFSDYFGNKEKKENEEQHIQLNQYAEIQKTKMLSPYLIKQFIQPHIYLFHKQLIDRITQDKIPKIRSIEEYIPSQFLEFKQAISKISAQDSFMVMFFSTNTVVGCYYPSVQLEREDILFACNQINFEIQSRSDQQQQQYLQAPGLRTFPKLKLDSIIFCSQKLELRRQYVMHNFHSMNQDFFTAYRMSIMIIE